MATWIWSTLVQLMACYLVAPSHCPYQYFSSGRFNGIQAITQKILQQPITKISLKITYQKFHSNLPGTNELMSMTPWRHWTHWQYRGEWVISVPISVTIFPFRLHCPHRRRLLRTWRWSKSIHPNVRPFQEVSGHLLENAWKEWLEIRFFGHGQLIS